MNRCIFRKISLGLIRLLINLKKGRLGKTGLDRKTRLGRLDRTTLGVTKPCGKLKSRPRRARKLGVSAAIIIVIVGGVIYWWRKRSTPLEDPWAEEYWANLSDSSNLPDLPVETAETTES